MFVTHDQLVAMVDLDHDVVLLEGPGGAEALEIWVMDPDTLDSSTHRSVVMDSEGNVLGDSQLED